MSEVRWTWGSKHGDMVTPNQYMLHGWDERARMHRLSRVTLWGMMEVRPCAT